MICQQTKEASASRKPDNNKKNMKFLSTVRGVLIFYLAMALSLGACATLPDVDSAQTAQAGPGTPTIVTSRGQLSPKQAQAIIKRLDAQAPGDMLARHIAVEEVVSGKPLVAGNKTLLHVDGPSTYAAMFEAMRKARDHINFETYIFEADEVGNKFAEMLLQKQAQGVQVNLIYDSVGSLSTPKEFFQRLRDAGMNVLEFNPINPLKVKREYQLNRRDHRKILIVDGMTAFTGGINVSDVYSKSSSRWRGSSPVGSDRTKEAWRDTQIQIEGPAAAEFQKLFMGTWERQKAAPLPQRNYFPTIAPQGNQIVRVIGSTPDHPDYEIYRTFLSALAQADHSAYLTFAYFVPDKQLVEALKTAAKRGVDVKLILPGFTDSGPVFYAARSHYADLLEAGIQVYERRDALLHAKTAVIDGVWSSVGSANLDLRSFLHNDEVNAIVLGRDFGQAMTVMFNKDLAAATQIEPHAWAKRPIGERFKEWSSRLLQYWL